MEMLDDGNAGDARVIQRSLSITRQISSNVSIIDVIHAPVQLLLPIIDVIHAPVQLLVPFIDVIHAPVQLLLPIIDVIYAPVQL